MQTKTNSAPDKTLIGPDRVMDVREMPCSIKHGLILRTCLELRVGTHFILLNGRDPAPLHDQISASWPGAFAWEYLVRTAEEVRVKITKLKAVKEDSDLPASHECSH
jgi:uncharacterized protein (DUF2249 family)